MSATAGGGTRSGASPASPARAASRDAGDHSLASLVGLVGPHLPDGLVDPRSHLRPSVRAVPAELAARFGFDCPLDGDAPGGDVLVCADAETAGLQLLAGRHPLTALAPSLARDRDWQPLIGLCRLREPGSLLHRAIDSACATLAPADRDGGREPAPAFCFGIRLAGGAEAGRRPIELLVRALELGLDTLRGGPPAAATGAALGALLRGLPEHARVVRAGVPRTGSGGGARLWLARLSRDEIAGVVERAGDGREARAIGTRLDELASLGVTVRLGLDIGAGGTAVLLECRVAGDGSPAAVAARWRPLLDRLVEAGLCTPRRRDALVLCYGLLRERRSEDWPEHLVRLSRLRGPGTESVVRWRLHHVELACDAGEPVGARACIVAAPGWAPR